MFKMLLILGVGVGVGYQLGWQDHERNTVHVATRLRLKVSRTITDVAKSKVDSLTGAATDSARQSVAPARP